MHYAEFPHNVAFLVEGKKTPDGGGGWLPGEWETYGESIGFWIHRNQKLFTVLNKLTTRLIDNCIFHIVPI